MDGSACADTKVNRRDTGRSPLPTLTPKHTACYVSVLIAFPRAAALTKCCLMSPLEIIPHISQPQSNFQSFQRLLNVSPSVSPHLPPNVVIYFCFFFLVQFCDAENLEIIFKTGKMDRIYTR